MKTKLLTKLRNEAAELYPVRYNSVTKLFSVYKDSCVDFLSPHNFKNLKDAKDYADLRRRTYIMSRVAEMRIKDSRIVY